MFYVLRSVVIAHNDLTLLEKNSANAQGRVHPFSMQTGTNTPGTWFNAIAYSDMGCAGTRRNLKQIERTASQYQVHLYRLIRADIVRL